jgi:ABC-type sugar transport system ATPase subunit
MEADGFRAGDYRHHALTHPTKTFGFFDEGGVVSSHLQLPLRERALSNNIPVSEPILQARGITKTFPGVRALNKVDFEVRAGEVHALLGENGAGKSTLMHILAGVYPPDEGTLSFQGRQVYFPDARAAQATGVSMVFQEGSLAPTLSVAENVFYSRQPVHRFGIINRQQLRQSTLNILDELGEALDPDMLVDRLSPAQRQMVEIAKALSLEARLLILDEPTSALSSEETEHLFVVIRQLARRGVGVIYISHRLAEVFQIADRMTVLKDGTCQGTYAVDELDSNRLISLMVGREFEFSSPAGKPKLGEGTVPALEVRELEDGELLSGINLTVHPAEIVALAGLAGAGRTELALSLFGARPYSRGTVLLEGKTACFRSPGEAIARGIGYLPEDRKEAGLFLEMSISANLAAGNLKHFGIFWLANQQMADAAQKYCERLRIVTPAVSKAVGELSGGNQQKVILARWLLIRPRVLMVDEPTRGVDVGAKAEVHGLLRELAQSGTAIVLISSELPEVLAMADRIYVMREGKIMGELKHTEASEEAVLRLASFAGGEHGCIG